MAPRAPRRLLARLRRRGRVVRPAPPSITLILDIEDTSVVQGAFVTFGATIVRSNFVGAVAVAVSSLPSGVTASVSAEVNGVRTITLAAAAGATVVTNDPVVITATAPDVPPATTEILLSVVASSGGGSAQAILATVGTTNFAQLLAPHALDDEDAPYSDSIPITLSRTIQNNQVVNNPVTLTVTGLPAGVTCASVIFPPGTERTNATTGAKSIDTVQMLLETVVEPGATPGVYTAQLVFSGQDSTMPSGPRPFTVVVAEPPGADAPVSVGAGNRFAELPRSVPTVPTALPPGAPIFRASSYGNGLAGALAAAVLVDADTIVVADDAGFTGGIELPPKAYPLRWTHIVCAAEYDAPGVWCKPYLGDADPGERVTAAHLGDMYPMQPNSATQYVISTPNITEAGKTNGFNATLQHVRRYRFVGMNIRNNAAITATHSGLVRLGSVNVTGLVVDQEAWLAQEIVFDRCRIGGDWVTAVRRPYFHAASRSLALVASWVTGQGDPVVNGQNQSDTPALGGGNCWGPLLIDNTRIEATGMVIFYGGNGNFLPTPVSDVTIRRSILSRPLFKNPSTTRGPDWPVWDGTDWRGKAMLEFKYGQRILVEDTIMENSWKSGWDGNGVKFSVNAEHETGNHEAYQTSDVTMRRVILRNILKPFTIVEFEQQSVAPNGVFSGRPVRRLDVYDMIIEIGSRAELNCNGPLASGTTGPSLDPRQAFNISSNKVDLARNHLRGSWSIRRNTILYRATEKDSAGVQVVIPTARYGAYENPVEFQDNLFVISGSRLFSSADNPPVHDFPGVRLLGWDVDGNVLCETTGGTPITAGLNANADYFAGQAPSAVSAAYPGAPSLIVNTGTTATSRMNGVGLIDRASRNPADWALAPTSPFHPANLAMLPADRRQKGANVALVLATTAGCESGVWS